MELAAPLDLGAFEHVEWERPEVSHGEEKLRGQDRGASQAQVLESPPPGALSMHQAAHALVARLKERLRACAVAELPPDHRDDLSAVVEVVGEPNQLGMKGRRELHRCEDRCRRVT